jgi:Domain of unknown function (DUF305)
MRAHDAGHARAGLATFAAKGAHRALNASTKRSNMYQTSIRRVLTMLPGKLPRVGFGTAVLGARLLFAFALPTHLMAQEVHPAAHPVAVAAADETAFLKENDDAMTKMMNGMAIKPSGDIDRDFVAMMNPHHQGAIDMAVIELRYGKNEQLRRIAQEIIVDQMQEIAAMKLAIGEPATETAPAPTQQQPASTQSASAPVEPHHSGMQMDMSPGMKH